MAQLTTVIVPLGKSNLSTALEYYLFRDNSKPDMDFYLYGIRIDANKGRAYEKLLTNNKRL